MAVCSRCLRWMTSDERRDALTRRQRESHTDSDGRWIVVCDKCWRVGVWGLATTKLSQT